MLIHQKTIKCNQALALFVGRRPSLGLSQYSQHIRDYAISSFSPGPYPCLADSDPLLLKSLPQTARAQPRTFVDLVPSPS